MFDKGETPSHQKLMIELKSGKVSNEFFLGEKISIYTDPSFCLTTIDQYTTHYKELIIINNSYPISESNKDTNGAYKIGYWKLIFQLGTRSLDLNTAYTHLVSGLKENKLWKINVDLSHFIHTIPTEPQFDDDSIILTPTTQDFYSDKKDEYLTNNGLIIHVYTPDYDNYNEIAKIYDFIQEKNLVSLCTNNLINYYKYNPQLAQTHILYHSYDIESKNRLQQSSLALQQKLCVAIWDPNTSSETLKEIAQVVYPLDFILREELFPTLKTHTELVGKSGANLLHLLMETEEEINSTCWIDRTNFIEILVEPRSSNPTRQSISRGKTLAAKLPAVVGFDKAETVKKDAQQHKKSMLNTCNDDGYTPAHLAVIHGKAKFLAKLMSYPELDDKITKNGDTLLHLCAKNNNNVLNLLSTLRNGDEKNLLLDLYKKNNDGYTPLHVAIVNNNFTFLNFYITTPFREPIIWYNINLCKAGPLQNNQDNLVHLSLRQLHTPPNSASETVKLFIQIERFLGLLARVASHMFYAKTAGKSTPLNIFTRIEIPKHFDESSKYELEQISTTIAHIITNARNFYVPVNNNNLPEEMTALQKRVTELESKIKEQTQEIAEKNQKIAQLEDQLKTNSNHNKSPNRDPRRNSLSITLGKQEQLTRVQFFDSPKNSTPTSSKGNDDIQKTIRKNSAPNMSRRQLFRNNSEGTNTLK